jgi:hypothetical protein
MKVAVTPLVRAQMEKKFSAADAAVACAELVDADLPLINSDGERVHLGIVHLCTGTLADFRTHLAVAKIDWRDTLVTAGLANLGWHRVLQARGIDPSSLAIAAQLRSTGALR